MAGHSAFKNIMHKKGRADAARARIFAKLGREITVAAKMGMPDPAMNARLRLAIQAARAENMPKDNIERAVKKASGTDTANYDSIRYEGYGPGGVAILVEAATDNRNRTASDVRSMFAKAGGQLAGSGAVAWQFEPRGLISIPAGRLDPDEIALTAIDAGASDVDTSDPSVIEVYTEPADLERVRAAIEAGGIAVESAESTMIAKQTVELDAHRARQNLRLIEMLEDLDDVQRVTANFDIPEDVFAELAG